MKRVDICSYTIRGGFGKAIIEERLKYLYGNPPASDDR